MSHNSIQSESDSIGQLSTESTVEYCLTACNLLFLFQTFDICAINYTDDRLWTCNYIETTVLRCGYIAGAESSDFTCLWISFRQGYAYNGDLLITVSNVMASFIESQTSIWDHSGYLALQSDTLPYSHHSLGTVVLHVDMFQILGGQGHP